MNTTQNKTKIFSTDNFCLAIFLKTKTCNLLRINKKNTKHSLFVFQETLKRQRLTQRFWDGKALVEPRSFYNSQRELKTLLYDDSYPAKTPEDS